MHIKYVFNLAASHIIMYSLKPFLMVFRDIKKLTPSKVLGSVRWENLSTVPWHQKANPIQSLSDLVVMMVLKFRDIKKLTPSKGPTPKGSQNFTPFRDIKKLTPSKAIDQVTFSEEGNVPWHQKANPIQSQFS